MPRRLQPQLLPLRPLLCVRQRSEERCVSFTEHLPSSPFPSEDGDCLACYSSIEVSIVAWGGRGRAAYAPQRSPSSPTPSYPAQSDPTSHHATPRPNPTRPPSPKPHPAQSSPAQPGPAKPSQPSHAQPGPSQSNPSQSNPAQSNPAHPRQAHPNDELEAPGSTLPL